MSSLATAARSETRDEWIALGGRVHGGFGAFIPVGIRIGLDALQRLNAKARELTVVYYDSDKAPCACVADGVAIATVADSWLPKLADWNKSLDAGGRYEAVMKADGLFDVTPLK